MIEKFQFEKTTLPGAYLIRPFYADDLRGGFIKDYNIDTFRENGLDYELKKRVFRVGRGEKRRNNGDIFRAFSTKHSAAMSF